MNRNFNKFTKMGKAQFALKAVREDLEQIRTASFGIQEMLSNGSLQKKFSWISSWVKESGIDSKVMLIKMLNMEKQAPVLQEYVEDKLEVLYAANNNGYQNYNRDQNDTLLGEWRAHRCSTARNKISRQ